MTGEKGVDHRLLCQFGANLTLPVLIPMRTKLAQMCTIGIRDFLPERTVALCENAAQSLVEIIITAYCNNCFQCLLGMSS